MGGSLRNEDNGRRPERDATRRVFVAYGAAAIVVVSVPV